MNTAIEILIRCDGDEETYTLADFPARIGRDDSCDLHLPYSFVSRRHARIEQDGSKFLLVDEGSVNGIWYGGRRIASGERVELRDGSEFVIENLTALVRFSEATQPMRFDESNREHATSLYAEQQVVPEVIARVGAVMEEYRGVRSAAVMAIAASLNEMPENERPATVRRLVALHPELTYEPDAVALFDRFGVDVRPPPPALPIEAQIALRGFERLAAVYVPDGPPPRDAKSIAAIVTCIHEALSAFVFAASELDAVRTGVQRSVAHDEAHMRKLGRELLDWTRPSGQAAQRMLDDFRAFASEHRELALDVDIALQHVGGDLSPEAIEGSTTRSWWHGPLWTKRLWREFVRRHQTVTAAFARRAGLRAVRGAPAALLPERSVVCSTGDAEAEAEPHPAEHWPFTRAPAWE